MQLSHQLIPTNSHLTAGCCLLAPYLADDGSDDEEEDRLYDEVDEAEYMRIRQERMTNDDFIVDDEGDDYGYRCVPVDMFLFDVHDFGFVCVAFNHPMRQCSSMRLALIDLISSANRAQQLLIIMFCSVHLVCTSTHKSFILPLRLFTSSCNCGVLACRPLLSHTAEPVPALHAVTTAESSGMRKTFRVIALRQSAVSTIPLLSPPAPVSVLSICALGSTLARCAECSHRTFTFRPSLLQLGRKARVRAPQ